MVRKLLTARIRTGGHWAALAGRQLAPRQTTPPRLDRSVDTAESRVGYVSPVYIPGSPEYVPGSNSAESRTGHDSPIYIPDSPVYIPGSPETPQGPRLPAPGVGIFLILSPVRVSPAAVLGVQANKGPEDESESDSQYDPEQVDESESDSQYDPEELEVTPVPPAPAPSKRRRLF